jgi:bromodomain-containing factor 1
MIPLLQFHNQELPLTHVGSTSFCRVTSRVSSDYPATIPVHPPTGTPPPPPGDLLEDVKLAEASTADVVMGDAATETPATTPGLFPDSSMATIVSNGASTSYSSPNDHSIPNDDHKPPPAKRARLHSDADMASLAHVSLFFLVRQ